MKSLILFALALLMTVPATSQTKSNFRIEGSNYIGTTMGFLQKTSVVVSGNDMNTRLGFSFGLNYFYGMTEEISLGISAGILSAQVSTNNVLFVGSTYVRQKSALVMPLLAGLKFSPKGLSIGPNGRPYLLLQAGSIQGYTTSETISNYYYQITTENKVESVFGVKTGAGLETSPAKFFRIGLFAGYLFTGDFNDRVGDFRNYSGIDVSLTAGFSF